MEQKSCTINLGESGNLLYDKINNRFFDKTSVEDMTRYLKGFFGNIDRFKDRGEEHFSSPLTVGLVKEINDGFEAATPFSYKEAFALGEDQFRALVFASVDITEMINELGATRIKTAGRPVKHKKFDIDGNFTGMEEYDVVYETYRVDCSTLNVADSYAVKCWCTSTNEEHWIWIQDQFKDNPLEAIASTFMVHESVKPYIKEIKRQGDIMLVELNQEVDVPENDPMVSLTADEYFGLLTAQS